MSGVFVIIWEGFGCCGVEGELIYVGMGGEGRGVRVLLIFFVVIGGGERIECFGGNGR